MRNGTEGYGVPGRQTRSMIIVDGFAGNGSVNTRIIRFVNLRVNMGDAIVYEDHQAFGGRFSITQDGIYAIGFSFLGDMTNITAAITVNDTQPTISATGGALTYAGGVRAISMGSVDETGFCSYTGFLKAGDVVTAHGDENNLGNNNTFIFNICRVC